MNKAELIDAITERLGDKRAAAHAVEAVVDTITRAVAKGEKVAITGFGVFEKQVRGPRTVRNPATGASIKKKKTAVPKFRPGAGFKQVVAGDKKLPPLPKATAGTATKSTGRGSTAGSTTSGGTRKSSATRSSATKSSATKSTAGTSTRKASTSKSTGTKSTAKRTAAKKSTTGRSTAAKKTTSSRAGAAKKTTAKKTTAKRTTARKR